MPEQLAASVPSAPPLPAAEPLRVGSSTALALFCGRGAVVRVAARGDRPVIHEIPAKSKLLPPIPITDRQFVYRRAGDTDVRATFARVRAALETDKPSPPNPVPAHVTPSPR